MTQYSKPENVKTTLTAWFFGRQIRMSSALYSAQRLLGRHGIALAHDISDRASCSYAMASLELICPAAVELHRRISAIANLCRASLPCHGEHVPVPLCPTSLIDCVQNGQDFNTARRLPPAHSLSPLRALPLFYFNNADPSCAFLPVSCSLHFWCSLFS